MPLEERRASNIISKETLMPIGVMIALLAPVFGLVFFFAGIRSDIADAKVQILTAQNQITVLQGQITLNSSKIATLDNRQSITDTQYAYISNTLDEIRKKLNIIP